MARLFGAEEVLVVSETQTAVADWPKADPIQTVNIRNNHLEYAITWAALAIGLGGDDRVPDLSPRPSIKPFRRRRLLNIAGVIHVVQRPEKAHASALQICQCVR